MFTENEILEIKDYLAKTKGTVYLGCDSVKFRRGNTWYARYTTVLVVHIEDSHGCKVFGFTDVERDYDAKQDKPRMRLMNEVYRVAGLYTQLGEELESRVVEIHLDVNPDEKHGSNVVIKEAVGYILGVTGIQPKVKPNAFAASYAADAGVRRDWF